VHRPLDGVYAALPRRGISRRTFIKFSGAMAAALALPASYGARIASAVEAAPRIPLVWLRGQACGGDSQAFLYTSDPTVGAMLVDLLSIDYFDAIMASSGETAGASRTAVVGDAPAGYIAVIEGSIPTAADGTACLVGGRPFVDVAREVCAGAIATIAVGSCAADGGLAAASGGTTGSVGAVTVASAGKLISLPGCPVNPDNLTATVVHLLTFGALPPADLRGRPLFAYGGLIHNQCERRAHFEFGEFVLDWGDEAAQKGWCLYKLGCKGPQTFANCPTIGYAEGTSWPVQAGHGCIGCTTPRFWDAMGPAYARLPPPLGFAPNITADQIGQAAVAGVAALTVVHGAASWVRGRHARAAEGTAASAIAETAPSAAREVTASGVEAMPAGPVPAGPEVAEADPRTVVTIVPSGPEAPALPEALPSEAVSMPEPETPPPLDPEQPFELLEPPEAGEAGEPPGPSADPT
jgi:hydrogenase small subunit